MDENIIVTVKNTVAKLYREREFRLFSPRHLVEMEGVAEIEDIDSVCNAFFVLTLMGYFTVELDVLDQDGGVVWGGDPAALNFNPAELEVGFEECFVMVSFRMTDLLEQEIGNQGTTSEDSST